MTRASVLGSSLVKLLVLCAGTGCSSASPRFETADSSAAEAPRRAPGVAPILMQSLPEAQASGAAEAQLLVLSAPASRLAMQEAVQRYFHALLEESSEELDALLAEPAWLESSAGRQPAKSALRARFAQFDFAALRGLTLFRASDLEVYRAEDARRLQSQRGVPADLSADQVFVRLRLLVSHSGKTRLFPDQMSLVLQAAASGFQITRITEFQ